MLSAKSEQFLIELRMYLMQRGKSDEDINGIVDELESHLIESEQNGRSVESIVGKDPEQYMKSINESLPVATRELLVLIPATILVILAYLAVVPALSGTFSLSHNVLLWGAVPVLVTLAIYALVLTKGLPKLHESPVKMALLILGVNLLTIGLWVLLYVWLGKQADTSYFVATAAQNYLIAAICIVIFIVYALYTKSWITIIVAAIISIGPIAGRWIPQDVNENPVYIVVAAVLSFAVVAFLLWRLFRQSGEKSMN
ncbi:MAG: DUF1129 family protein [Bacillota bacterium]